MRVIIYCEFNTDYEKFLIFIIVVKCTQSICQSNQKVVYKNSKSKLEIFYGVGYVFIYIIYVYVFKCAIDNHSRSYT